MEPQYEYVKGQGWVLGNPKSWTIYYGQYRVTLYDRIPTLNEHYYNLNSNYWENGSLNFDKAWIAIEPDMKFRPNDMGGFISSAYQLDLVAKMSLKPDTFGKFVVIAVE